VWRKTAPETVTAVTRAVNAGLALSPQERASDETFEGVGLAVQSRFETQQIYRNSRVLLTCDAELLNEAELRAGLDSGLDLSGTAALLAALYARHGSGFVEKLRGGFAVILWDIVERRLFAAIDGFGIKRLAWYDDEHVMMIATRADALRAGTGRLRINPRAIANVLNFSANLAPETIFEGVHRLLPGNTLTASTAGTRTDSYWDLSYGGASGASEAALSRELEAVMERSVTSHCAGVPRSALGGFLSGGTDSSTVIGLMTRAAGEPVNAFSIGFQEPGFNELDYAEMAARAFSAKHHTYLVSARDCTDSLDSVVRCLDEPFGNSSAVATYFCARLAAEHGVYTLLAGDGGDELFGGNERYATENIFEPYQSIPKPLRTAVIEPLAALPIDVSVMRKARNYIRRANMAGVERMLSFQFLKTHAAAEIFDGDFLRSLDGYDVADIPARHYAAPAAGNHLDRLMYVDMKITLADNDLPKVTRMAELAGVTTRFPFLDRSVAQFSGQLPTQLKVKGFQKRYLFKKAFGNLLPTEIIRKKKHGFGIPVAVWMKNDPRMREVTHDTLGSARAYERGYFRRQFIEELLRKHDSDGDIYYGDTLWVFLLLELWHRQVVDQQVGAPA
jgi:asparagine synthase (glutamine-hydrolysing)